MSFYGATDVGPTCMRVAICEQHRSLQKYSDILIIVLYRYSDIFTVVIIIIIIIITVVYVLEALD